MNRAGKASTSLCLISLLIIPLVTAIFSSTANLVATEETGTQVSGIISQDTTWTVSNSPYTFTGPVVINSDVTLIIQPGVTVNLGSDNYFQINGTLCAVGSQTNPINFNNGRIVFTPLSSNYSESVGSGCIIQNAVLSWIGAGSIAMVLVEGGSPKINNNTILYRAWQSACIQVSGGAPIISNNSISISTFIIAASGISISPDSSPKIYNNTFYGTDAGYAIRGLAPNSETQFGNPRISGNNLYGNFYHGILAYNGTINQNFLQNSGEISGNNGTLIVDNLIINSNGISGSNCIIENNTIVNNGSGNGLTITAPSTLIGNNLYGSQYNIYCTSTSNIDATYNYWGMTDAQAINQTIYDFKNNINYGNVTFIPFLMQPNPKAPIFLSASASAGGNITPNGILTPKTGDSLHFDITTNVGYHLEDVLVNGTSVGSVSSYYIQNIQGITTILAIFEATPIIVSLSNSSSTQIYMGQSVQFTASAIGASGHFGFRWYVNDSLVYDAGSYSLISSTFTFTPSNSGNYEILVQATDPNSPTLYHFGNNSTIVNVLDQPVPTPSPSPTSTAPTATPTPTDTPPMDPTPTPTLSPTQAPISNPTATPTIPEFSPLIVIALLLTMGSAVMLMLKRKLR